MMIMHRTHVDGLSQTCNRAIPAVSLLLLRADDLSSICTFSCVTVPVSRNESEMSLANIESLITAITWCKRMLKRTAASKYQCVQVVS